MIAGVIAAITITLPKQKHFIDKKNQKEYDILLQDELNVKEVKYKVGKKDIEVEYDTKITAELQLEGDVRDLLRSIQQKRKELGVQISELVKLVIPKKFEKFGEMIKRQVNANSIGIGEEMKVEKNI